MPWKVQMEWRGEKVMLPGAFARQGDAEYAAGQWRQANDCRRDPFWFFEVAEPIRAAVPGTDEAPGFHTADTAIDLTAEAVMDPPF